MKKIISAALVLALSLSAFTPALAASSQAEHTAGILYKNNIFSGKGLDEKGKPVFDLDSKASRQEATTLLVTLIGKAEEAKTTPVNIPFTDVADWAKPYVSYAYNNGIVAGMSNDVFGADEEIKKDQFMTMVLCALGYEANTDFLWHQSQYLAKKILLIDEIKNEEYTREDIVLLSHRALYTKMKDSDKTLAEYLGIDLDSCTYETSEELIAVIKARYGFDIEFEDYIIDEDYKLYMLETFYNYCRQTVPDVIMRDLASFRKTIMFTYSGEPSLGSRIIKIPVTSYDLAFINKKETTAFMITKTIPQLLGDFMEIKYWRDIPEDLTDEEFNTLIGKLIFMYDTEYDDGIIKIKENHAQRAIKEYNSTSSTSEKSIVRVNRKLETVHEFLCTIYDLDEEESRLIDPYGFTMYK